MDLNKIIEELQAQKATATNKEKMGTVLDSAIEGLKIAYALSPDEKSEMIIDNLKATILELENTNSDLEIQLEEAQEIAKDALEKFNNAVLKSPAVLELELEGKTVKINYGVTLSGKSFTATQLANSPAVVKELLAMGSGSVSILEGK